MAALEFPILNQYFLSRLEQQQRQQDPAYLLNLKVQNENLRQMLQAEADRVKIKNMIAGYNMGNVPQEMQAQYGLAQTLGNPELFLSVTDRISGLRKSQEQEDYLRRIVPGGVSVEEAVGAPTGGFMSAYQMTPEFVESSPDWRMGMMKLQAEREMEAVRSKDALVRSLIDSGDYTPTFDKNFRITGITPKAIPDKMLPIMSGMMNQITELESEELVDTGGLSPEEWIKMTPNGIPYINPALEFHPRAEKLRNVLDEAMKLTSLMQVEGISKEAKASLAEVMSLNITQLRNLKRSLLSDQSRRSVVEGLIKSPTYRKGVEDLIIDKQSLPKEWEVR